MLGVVVAVLVAVLLAVLALFVRRALLLRRVGTFPCSLRRARAGRAAGSGWSYGLARYRGDRLEWFRLFSLSARPRRVLLRRELRIRFRREIEPAEVPSVPPSAMVVGCRLVPGNPREDDAAADVELAMNRDAVTGFLSWVEATSPGGPMVT